MKQSDPSAITHSHDESASIPIHEVSNPKLALRIADANCNRVMEGLRTLEDIARFADRRSLQAAYKSHRHALQRSLALWDRYGMLASRNADQDVGKLEKQPTERDRSSGLESIVAAAVGRCEQGLRVLEEMAKFLAPDSAPAIEAIRYQIYDTNAQMQLETHRDTDFLRRARLYVLVDCRSTKNEFAARLRDISNAGVDLIQVRDKNADARTLVEYTKIALENLVDKKTRVIVNDRADIAATTGAWGVHVGQEDLAPAAARSIMRSHQIVGQSTHDVGQLDAAIASRVDYVGCGPTFPSSTKSFSAFAGPDFLRSVAKHLDGLDCDLPAFAIGGITLENVELVASTGIARVAVGSAIWQAENPGLAAKAIRALLDASPCVRSSRNSLH